MTTGTLRREFPSMVKPGHVVVAAGDRRSTVFAVTSEWNGLADCYVYTFTFSDGTRAAFYGRAYVTLAS